MISEIAQFSIKPGMEAQFEQGVAQAKPIFLRARGCHGLNLLKSIEEPSLYTLVVSWDTVEDHMVHFRESADFLEWRRLVGDCFAAAPKVGHASTVL
ncbi:antibiotic biosynthesis monooxygenase [Cupriavidus sp. USMAA2-4]|uniref:Antibiotic biosynthesis monooxygenase n=1 Tax=Cupriavidus malaysiensis TaxID=367825 RepID=A0ABN4TTT5_9BURK|nr:MULTISPECIES: antibiotic biosynthesis monooxygenase family protein [Cupriavidus]AOY96683.1 antibiotic biosynthesis monooxygenase [Cupriavidus sp. USMAA2-4]AOZ02912.1 antibiotic biosynthesis monooxygenase [Cupriavidus sp. USMAHM13]AOZ09716.1 antibiotic biosynthesis monooxygenase [Cupriavidus malaysiensis]